MTNSYQNTGYNNRGGNDVWVYVGRGHDDYGNPIDIERNQYGEERYIKVGYNGGYTDNFTQPYAGGREVIYV